VIITAVGHHDRRPDFTSVVDDHQPLFDQDTGSRLEPTMPVQSAFTSYVPMPCESGTVPVIEPFTLETWLDVPVAVVAAKDDSDHRLDQPAGCRARALNLNAVVASHGSLAALFPPPVFVVLLTIGAHHPRTTKDHGRGQGDRAYPSCSSHIPSFDTPVNRLASGARTCTGGIPLNPGFPFLESHNGER
jgi:hypothetical protein